MSADNGIYILKTMDNWKILIEEDGLVSTRLVKEPILAFRVAHAQAIDNFEWYEKNQLYKLGKYMEETWGNSPVFYNEDEANAWAKGIERRIRYTEYGIKVIDGTKYSFN